MSSRSARRESKKQRAGSGKAAEEQKAAGEADKRAKGHSEKKTNLLKIGEKSLKNL